MNSLFSMGSNAAAIEATAPSETAAADNGANDVADTGLAVVGQPPSSAMNRAAIRPLLQRGPPSGPSAQPPLQAGASTGQNGGNNSNSPPQPDSLSLAQLRRIMTMGPDSEPTVYDYEYTDTGSLAEEVDEWFIYQFWQWVRLNAVQRAFEWQWDRDHGRHRWALVDAQSRERFMSDSLNGFTSPDQSTRSASIGKVLYVVLGRWGETAGGVAPPTTRDPKIRSAATPAQLKAMKDGVQLLGQVAGFPIVWRSLTRAFQIISPDVQEAKPSGSQELLDELMNLMTILYMSLQQAISCPDDFTTVHDQLCALNPGLVDFLAQAAAKLRWDEGNALPHTQIFLLLWKSILVVFGGTKELAETKKALGDSTEKDSSKETITASPLDYHVFRQEVLSKYPAYIPPQLALPLEAETTSLLPPLPNHQTRNNGANGILPASTAQIGGASILNQPVHIATPAPSPPPSPSIGGKGGKKQNYQTNQNFPFMYPPLDASSNVAGGKGLAAYEDGIVGRRWEGSDIPASILEAGELFSKRVRMTRSTRQLWAEREKFLKFDRGWEGADEDIVDELDLSSLTLEEKQELGLLKDKKPENSQQPSEEEGIDFGFAESPDAQLRQRLEAVESFYRNCLPQLQSLIIVLLKAILAIATNLVIQGTNAQGPNGVNAGTGKVDAPPSPSDDEVDAVRTREIAAKAVTGVLVMLLKWTKVSHVLKFEYLTQLLLDSNYLPLVLKLFALHDIPQVLDSKSDRLENSFFYFCSERASAGNMGTHNVTELEEDSEDDAMPPPIKRRRSPPPRPSTASGDDESDPSAPSHVASSIVPAPQVRPEVDEMGFAVNIPKEIVTDFSRRNFFSLINYLRIMQKICKNKAHRNLLLMHYKSSTILRKCLKTPQPELRLYTLKLFKSQVPYSTRKWRQGNMRVITAVYLFCKPVLRDEWLAGGDVDGEIEDALPLEQALRSLTHWFNVTRYPDAMGPEVATALKEERDFFIRELERLDVNWADMGPEESVAGDWEGDGPAGIGMLWTQQ